MFSCTTLRPLSHLWVWFGYKLCAGDFFSLIKLKLSSQCQLVERKLRIHKQPSRTFPLHWKLIKWSQHPKKSNPNKVNIQLTSSNDILHLCLFNIPTHFTIQEFNSLRPNWRRERNLGFEFSTFRKQSPKSCYSGV